MNLRSVEHTRRETMTLAAIAGLAAMLAPRMSFADEKAVAAEIELDFENLLAKGHRSCPQTPRSHVKRNLPAMIDPGRQRQSDFADDLSPEMQRRGRCVPRRIRQIRPAIEVALHCGSHCYSVPGHPGYHVPVRASPSRASPRWMLLTGAAARDSQAGFSARVSRHGG